MTIKSNWLISWEKKKQIFYGYGMQLLFVLVAYSLFSDSSAPLLVQWQIPPD